jgi:hypothetical protein
MRVDVSQSVYHEADDVVTQFDRNERRRARQLLRRLRFLEAKVRETGGMAGAGASGGAAFAEWEMEALEWVLDEIGFLSEDRTQREPADIAD